MVAGEVSPKRNKSSAGGEAACRHPQALRGWGWLSLGKNSVFASAKRCYCAHLCALFTRQSGVDVSFQRRGTGPRRSPRGWALARAWVRVFRTRRRQPQRRVPSLTAPGRPLMPQNLEIFEAWKVGSSGYGKKALALAVARVFPGLSVGGCPDPAKRTRTGRKGRSAVGQDRENAFLTWHKTLCLWSSLPCLAIALQCFTVARPVAGCSFSDDFL